MTRKFCALSGNTVFDNYKTLVQDAIHTLIVMIGVSMLQILLTFGILQKIVLMVLLLMTVKMVACTDETVWFIHRDIIDEYYSH